MQEQTVKARNLQVGDRFVDYDEEEFAGTNGTEILTVTPGNGIVRFTTPTGSGYFDEDSDVVVVR